MNGRHRHPIQYAILERLRTSPSGLRYSEMKPAWETENDLYNYHLQHLSKQGLIDKFDDKYFLSESGKKYLIELNPLNESGDSHRFKLASLCLLKDGDGPDTKFLYQLRTRQPFAGARQMIGGGIMRGELAAEAAGRRLQQEAGLLAKFRLFGLIRKLRIDLEGEIYSDILYHVCVSEEHSGELDLANDFGEHSWLSLEEAIAVESTGVTGSNSFARIIEQLKSGPVSAVPLFYVEETYHHDIY